MELRKRDFAVASMCSRGILEKVQDIADEGKGVADGGGGGSGAGGCCCVLFKGYGFSMVFPEFRNFVSRDC
ncbi:hypothetical protein M0802_006329 [Mischocyttarus mexicanus]|nr:hypothetical protein M0802_006329 [Mischocyttarus mexicanus]